MNWIVLLFLFQELVNEPELSDEFVIEGDLEHLVFYFSCFAGILLDVASILVKFDGRTIFFDGLQKNFPLLAFHLSFIISQKCINIFHKMCICIQTVCKTVLSPILHCLFNEVLTIKITLMLITN